MIPRAAKEKDSAVIETLPLAPSAVLFVTVGFVGTRPRDSMSHGVACRDSTRCELSEAYRPTSAVRDGRPQEQNRRQTPEYGQIELLYKIKLRLNIAIKVVTLMETICRLYAWIFRRGLHSPKPSSNWSRSALSFTIGVLIPVPEIDVCRCRSYCLWGHLGAPRFSVDTLAVLGIASSQFLKLPNFEWSIAETPQVYTGLVNDPTVISACVNRYRQSKLSATLKPEIQPEVEGAGHSYAVK